MTTSISSEDLLNCRVRKLKSKNKKTNNKSTNKKNMKTFTTFFLFFYSLTDRQVDKSDDLINLFKNIQTSILNSSREIYTSNIFTFLPFVA